MTMSRNIISHAEVIRRNVKDHITRQKGLDCVSNYQPHHWLLNRLFGCRSKKTSKLRVTGLCVRNSKGAGEFLNKWPVTRKCSICWCHHAPRPYGILNSAWLICQQLQLHRHWLKAGQHELSKAYSCYLPILNTVTIVWVIRCLT